MSPNFPPSIASTFPFKEEDHAISLGSTMIVRRNLARYNFPSKLQPQEKEQVLQKLKSALEDKSLHFSSQKDLSSSDRDLLFEHFLFHKSPEKNEESSEIGVDEAGKFLTLINSANHLEMRALNIGTPLSETWNMLSQMDTEIGKKETFAFSPKFGFLTADPANSGTGLTVCIHLHLPALIHNGQIESAITNAEDEEAIFMGLAGDLFEIIGDIILVQNNFSLGVSEEAILHSVDRAATKLIGAEKTMRTHLKEEQPAEMKDLVHKAFGLLIHSFQLETKEALDFLSLMKLGLDLGIVQNVSDKTLSELYFKCRRGFLTHKFPDLSDPKEIEKKRAEFLQEQLAGISLT